MATDDAYIGCRSGNLSVAHGAENKHINLYPLAKPLLESENRYWDDEEHDLEAIHPVLTIAQDMSLKEISEENMINCHISNPDFSQHLEGQFSPNLDMITNLQNSYKCDTTAELHSTLLSAFLAYSMTECGGKVIEISSGKSLNINSALTLELEEQLI